MSSVIYMYNTAGSLPGFFFTKLISYLYLAGLGTLERPL